MKPSETIPSRALNRACVERGRASVDRFCDRFRGRATERSDTPCGSSYLLSKALRDDVKSSSSDQ